MTNFRLLDRQLQSLHMASRKRQYRHRVRCEECNKEIDSDYKEVHSRLVHNGKKVKCHPVMESSDLSQSKISTFFVKSNMTTKDDDNPNLRL